MAKKSKDHSDINQIAHRVLQDVLKITEDKAEPELGKEAVKKHSGSKKTK